MQQWKGTVLKIAAVYNILWGLWAILFPQQFFTLTNMAPINHPMIWQGMGMVIGVYGLGYWWASYAPVRHWPIVAVGFLGKLFGPAGYVFNLLTTNIDPRFGLTLITNDLIWWVPFFLILKEAHIQNWPLHDQAT